MKHLQGLNSFRLPESDCDKSPSSKKTYAKIGRFMKIGATSLRLFAIAVFSIIAVSSAKAASEKEARALLSALENHKNADEETNKKLLGKLKRISKRDLSGYSAVRTILEGCPSYLIGCPKLHYTEIPTKAVSDVEVPAWINEVVGSDVVAECKTEVGGQVMVTTTVYWMLLPLDHGSKALDTAVIGCSFDYHELQGHSVKSYLVWLTDTKGQLKRGPLVTFAVKAPRKSRD